MIAAAHVPFTHGASDRGGASGGLRVIFGQPIALEIRTGTLPPIGSPQLNNPLCTTCGHRFAWGDALRQVFGLARKGSATWGAVCPACEADLKVPNARMLLIAAAGIFFGSQSSTLLLVGSLDPVGFWLVKLGMIVGFYAIAVFFFLKLEPVA